MKVFISLNLRDAMKQTQVTVYGKNDVKTAKRNSIPYAISVCIVRCPNAGRKR